MTKCLQFHKDDELILVREQKKIIKLINSLEDKNSAYPLFPLFCPLSNPDYEGIPNSQFKNIFSKIKIQNIEILENKLFFNVCIETNEQKIFQEKLYFARLSKWDEKINKIIKEEIFEKEIRIFQIIEIKKTGFSYEIWNPVWCKLS